MNDLIDRQLAISAICVDGTQLERKGYYTMTMAERKQRDADILNALPSAQPERQKGIWLDDEGKKKENGYCGNCSVCGVMSEYLTDYCSHCGADMRDELKGESNANA